MEKNNEWSKLDFGARIYDARLGRFLSMDTKIKNYPYNSSYLIAANSPIYNIDIEGEFSVGYHYKIAYRAALSLGYSKEMADKIAYMSSTYADHPDPEILNMGGIINTGDHLKYGRFGVYYKKGPTADSQKDEPYYVTWHSMRTDWEAEHEGMTAEQAVERGMSFGWDQVLGAAKMKDVAMLGQGIHALQDADAHKGASMREHLGDVDSFGKRTNSSWSAIKMLVHDVLGSGRKASLWSEQALQVYGLLTDNKDVINKMTSGGQITLNLKGQSTENIEKIAAAIEEKGYTNVRIYIDYDKTTFKPIYYTKSKK